MEISSLKALADENERRGQSCKYIQCIYIGTKSNTCNLSESFERRGSRSGGTSGMRTAVTRCRARLPPSGACASRASAQSCELVRVKVRVHYGGGGSCHLSFCYCPCVCPPLSPAHHGVLSSVLGARRSSARGVSACWTSKARGTHRKVGERRPESR